MADTTKVLGVGESMHNAIEPLRLALEDIVEAYNSRQKRLWELNFGADVIKAVAKERDEDFNELYGSIENAVSGKGKGVFHAIAGAAEGSESLEAYGIDKFLALQIAEKAAEKMPPEGQREGKQIAEGSYVEFEAVGYSNSRKKGEWHVLGAKVRYKPNKDPNCRELAVWDPESESYHEIYANQDFFVGNLLPIEVEDDRDFVYYNVRIAIAKVPEAELPKAAAKETSDYGQRPVDEPNGEPERRKRNPTRVDIEAAELFASFGAEGGTASEERVSAVLEKVMENDGGNGTNGAAKKPGMLDARIPKAQRTMGVHNGGGSAYAP